MFEPGFDQAAGLRAEPSVAGPVLMPVASPAQPERGYEWLCTLASSLSAEGRTVAIVDGTANESRSNDQGLMRALQDPSIANLERPVDEAADWLVLPGAAGLQALLETARTAGASSAIARLLAPFAAGVVVLLFAPAHALASLLQDLNARTLVPVVEQPQASIDAYGAVKLLAAADVLPVLAPLAASQAAASALQTVVHNVIDTAERHLHLALDCWPAHSWALRVQESAIPRPARAYPAHGVHGVFAPAAAPSLWS
ncbi:hypothetical protein [Hydrogenophaga sp. BPS33]|uniref:hypothetical protein n=1 Tax=Hydrogenophaga sp. BPS33 TaxID=2651974 RepID=UPI00131FF5FC|nr:hypothetical protein [Hydrogenophaga sp. BPS33]QHE88079.1 hypothetical protein F9K07_25885 [Hydrogenophaga sp. BPS33]